MFISKFVKWLLAGVVLIILTACGGGSNTTIPDAETVSEAQTIVNSNVVIVNSNDVNDIVINSSFEDKNTNLTVTEEIAKSLKEEDIFYLPSDSNNYFPFGIVGKVESVSGENIELSQVSYADIVSQSKLEEQISELNSDNFIGVIAPNNVSPSAASKQFKKYTGNSDVKSYLKGGVVFIGNETLRQEKSFLGDGGSVSTGNIALNLEVNLANIANVASLSNPISTHKEAKVIISGSLNNLKLYESHDIDIFGKDVELNIRAEGELHTEVKIQGSMSATIGNFNQAWREVEKATYEKLGASVALSGLDSKDKYGKYPIVGLLFKGITPTPVKTQTGVRLAKSGGIILWVYINAKGEITLDGETGVGINAKFKVGVDKPKDKGLDFIKSVTNIENTRLMETPFIDGTLTQTATFGMSVDVDSFAFGIRMASGGVDFIGKQSLVLQTDGGRASYGFDTFGSGWSWAGSKVCIDGSLGAGVIFTGDVSLGIDIDAGIFGDGKGSFIYDYQYPKQEDIENATSIGWVGTWYNIGSAKECFNQNAPIANAGEDQTVKFGDSIHLSGSQSSDSDGEVISYVWSHEGSVIDSGESIVLNDLSAGEHLFILTVTDNDGLIGTDEIIVTILDEVETKTLNWSGKIIFKDMNGTVQPIPSNTRIRITPNEEQINGGWGGVDSIVDSNGNWSVDYVQNSLNVDILNYTSTNKYQFIVFNNSNGEIYPFYSCSDNYMMLNRINDTDPFVSEATVSDFTTTVEISSTGQCLYIEGSGDFGPPPPDPSWNP